MLEGLVRWPPGSLFWIHWWLLSAGAKQHSSVLHGAAASGAHAFLRSAQGVSGKARSSGWVGDGRVRVGLIGAFSSAHGSELLDPDSAHRGRV